MNDPHFVSELLRRTADGDRAAFELLYRESSGLLYALCLRVLKREDLAADALQETYVSIWRDAVRYDASHAAPTTWMGAIARHRALDLRRRQRPAEVLESQLDGWTSDALRSERPGPLESTLRAADSAALHGCLQTLSEEQRSAVLATFLDGDTHREAAQRLAKPLGTIKSWVRRGLDKLRRCLDGET